MIGVVCDNLSMATATRARTSFGKDTGLQARMLLTMFLLPTTYQLAEKWFGRWRSRHPVAVEEP